jgi:hypothetical protein
MRMPKHTLKLLAPLMALSVAPVSAGHCVKGPCAAAAPAVRHHSDCPYERARAAAAAAEAWQAPRAPTTVTLTDRMPADGSLLDLGRGSTFLP